MSAGIKNSYGKVTFDDSCIATLAGISATECYGLVGMAEKNVGETLAKIFKSDSLKKGVIVKTDGSENVVVELRINAQYGVSLVAVAENIIEKVKYSVEKDTGLNVESVNIVVSGIEV